MSETLQPTLVPGLIVNAFTHEVFVDGYEVNLTKTEFDLLRLLMGHPRVVMTPAILVHALWGYDVHDVEHPLEVHVSRLRHKLGESGSAQRYIRTVRGVGYRFEPDRPLQRTVFLSYDAELILRSIRPDDEPLLGYRPEDIVDTFFLISHFTALNVDRLAALAHIQSLLDAGVDRVDTPTLGRCADGTSIPVHIVSDIKADASGKFIGLEGHVTYPTSAHATQ